MEYLYLFKDLSNIFILNNYHFVIKKRQINKFIDLPFYVGPPGLEPGTF